MPDLHVGGPTVTSCGIWFGGGAEACLKQEDTGGGTINVFNRINHWRTILFLDTVIIKFSTISLQSILHFVFISIKSKITLFSVVMK